MSTVTPTIEFVTVHGSFTEEWPCPPRVGEYVVVPTDDHGPNKAEIVRHVVWSALSVMVATDCVDLP